METFAIIIISLAGVSSMGLAYLLSYAVIVHIKQSKELNRITNKFIEDNSKTFEKLNYALTNTQQFNSDIMNRLNNISNDVMEIKRWTNSQN
ncbi:MAG: hypothetical protein HXX16_17175 [Bacteroidales bacterium]|nr:hypothetical protein [Bacteroidales bacterium]